MTAGKHIQTTTVGSYPIPSWLVAAPSEQALLDATRVVIATQEQAASISSATASSIDSTSTIPRPTA